MEFHNSVQQQVSDINTGVNRYNFISTAMSMAHITAKVFIMETQKFDNATVNRLILR